jgi:GxxExxY protein
MTEQLVKRRDAGDAEVDRREIQDAGTCIVECATEVHRALGPGLLESAYQACLAHDLRTAGLDVRCEVSLPVTYKDIAIDAGYRMDMVVAKCVVVENKCVESLLPIHLAQLLTYLRLGDFRLGYLLNWNVPLMKKGIKRVVNNL